jgi:hypothetical protein
LVESDEPVASHLVESDEPVASHLVESDEPVASHLVEPLEEQLVLHQEEVRPDRLQTLQKH